MKEDKALNVAIVGGGSRCKAIMDMIFAEKLSSLRMQLIGVADIDPGAVGYRHAQEKGIYTTTDYHELCRLKDLNMIIEVTGNEKVVGEIFRIKPAHVRMMDHVAARLFWDIFRIEEGWSAERKQAYGALRENERFLRNVFDAIQDGLSVLDYDLNVLQTNLWMEKMFPSQRPLVGNKCYKVYQKRDSPCPQCPSLPTLATGEMHAEIIPYPSEDHPTGWFELSAFPLKNRHGRVVGVIEHIKNITKRREAEQALRVSQAKYSKLVENALTGIYIDQGGKIIFANSRFAEIYGYSREELSGMESWKLVHPDDRALTDKMRAKRLKGEEASSEYEARGLTKHGQTIWVRRRNTRIDYNGKPAVLGNIVDITEQKNAENELTRRHHELQAINGILLRITKEYNLNNMGFVLQDIMEEFYPEVETLVLLLAPNREAFYYPQPERGQIKQSCYDRAKKTIVDHNLEPDLLKLLTTHKELRPTCSGRKADSPAPIRHLTAGYNSWITVPIEVEDVCHGLFIVGSSSADIRVEDDLIFIESLIRQISGVIRYQVSKEVQEEAFRKQLTGPDKFMGIVGRSKPMHEIYRLIQAVADSESTALITGESGTGKELVARGIHQAGKYKDTPFIAAHCSSFVPTLVHSELFGHEKGAFTGATSRKLGRLERAQGGIVFLDEVADLPLETQVLLLRFLQDKSFERVGGERPVQVNVRIIAATNKAIEKEMKAGRLREDFYYRLNVIPIHVPPLRERITDVPLLANHFLTTYCLVEGKQITGFDTEAMRVMMDYDWPGNVRELENTVARCIVLSTGGLIGVEQLPEKMRTPLAAPKEYTLAQNEKNLIMSVMRECNWNKHKAARLLDISRGTLYSKLKKHHISR